jgi:rare lipoprotein A (peptidoglycan hydrolase)
MEITRRNSMRRILLAVTFAAVAMTMSFTSKREVLASWYHTAGTRVHRDFPTAAMNGVPLYSKFEVTNIRNGKSCVVTITDRMHPSRVNNIDLSHSAFGLIENHQRGVTRVTVNKFDEQ